MRAVLGQAQGTGEQRNQDDAATDPEPAAGGPRDGADGGRGEAGSPVQGAAATGFWVFCTSRTTSAKRVALVGAPSTTAIMSRPPVRIQVARQ